MKLEDNIYDSRDKVEIIQCHSLRVSISQLIAPKTGSSCISSVEKSQPLPFHKHLSMKFFTGNKIKTICLN